LKSINQLAIATAIAIILIARPAFSWDGTDQDSGNAVEIEKGQLVRTGNDIQYFDYSSGEYKSVTVNSIARTGASVEIEVEDTDTGETRTLDMDDR
jgi:hypothetical protein